MATDPHSTRGAAARTASARRWWLRAHRYLGLSLGGVFAVVGLSGSLLVFWQPIDALLDPQRPQLEDGCTETAHRPIHELVAAAHTRAPAGSTMRSIGLPGPEQPLLWARVELPRAGADYGDSLDIFVQPCSGTPSAPRLWDTQPRPWEGPLMGVVMRLHTSLLLNRPGSWLGNHVLSTSAILLVLSVLSGLWLWWPRRTGWRRALRLRLGAGAQPLAFDLHRSAGALAALLLLVALLTGVHMYDPWHGLVNDAVRKLSPATRFGLPDPAPATIAGAALLPVSRAIATAQAGREGQVPTTVWLPDAERHVYAIELRGTAAWNSRVVLDARSGAVLADADPHVASAGDHFLNWLFPLHTGAAFGLPGRIGVLVLGLVPSLLLVTGLLWWARKRKARNEAARRAATVPAPRTRNRG